MHSMCMLIYLLVPVVFIDRVPWLMIKHFWCWLPLLLKMFLKLKVHSMVVVKIAEYLGILYQRAIWSTHCQGHEHVLLHKRPRNCNCTLACFTTTNECIPSGKPGQSSFHVAPDIRVPCTDSWIVIVNFVCQNVATLLSMLHASLNSCTDFVRCSKYLLSCYALIGRRYHGVSSWWPRCSVPWARL